MVPIYFNYAREILQGCFALKLQKCFEDDKTSPRIFYQRGGEYKDGIYIFRWTLPLTFWG